MEVKFLKTKTKVILPPECEIFAVEEAYQKLNAKKIVEKPVEIDFSKVSTIDTTFIQLIVSLIKTVKAAGKTYSIKNLSEEIKKKFELYGIDLNDL